MMLAEDHVWPTIASNIISACSALAGIAVGAWFTSRNQKRERKNARIREQLQGFYSPLLGMRSEIATKSYVRNKVSSASDAEWRKLFDDTHDPAHKADIEKNEWPRFERAASYSDQQLIQEIVPVYRRMLEHITNNLWLAEPSTQQFYPEFFEFVEVWNRFVKKSIPVEVVKRLEHSEAKLTAFYKDLYDTFERLQASLSN